MVNDRVNVMVNPIEQSDVVCDEAIDQTVGYVILFGQEIEGKESRCKPIV